MFPAATTRRERSALMRMPTFSARVRGSDSFTGMKYRWQPRRPLGKKVMRIAYWNAHARASTADDDSNR